MSDFRRRKWSDKDWVRIQPGTVKHALYMLHSLGYRLIPPSFSASFTLGQLVLGGTQISLVALIALVPVIFAEVVAPAAGLVPPPSSPATNPYYQAALLFALMVAKVGVDRLRTYATVRQEHIRSLRHLAVNLNATIGEIERQIVQFSNSPQGAARIDQFLQHALKCIEATVMLCTGKTDPRYCCVTLLTFEVGDQLHIRSRSTVERAIGAFIPQDNTFSFLAAKYAKNSLVVHNYRWAGWFRKERPVNYKSLTSPGKPLYESILILPLPEVTIAGQNRRIKGTVTIDSARPYEFLGKDLAITISVGAYLHLINLMLTNHTVGIEAEA